MPETVYYDGAGHKTESLDTEVSDGILLPPSADK
jgi:hypothetical protein